MRSVSTGDIFFVDLGSIPNEVRGHEQANTRPAIIIKSLDALKLVVIVPLTSKKNSYFSATYLPKSETGLKKDSYALCHQIRTVSVERLDNKVGMLSQRGLNKIRSVLVYLLNL